MNTSIYTSPLGDIILAQDGGALIGLWFRSQKYESAGVPEGTPNIGIEDEPVFAAAADWLDEYFAGKAAGCRFPLAPRGTEFQRRVWAELMRIPYGETRTYAEIAKSVGCAGARAVGSAIGKNPISLIIPCHRVIGAGGSLTGYAGGIERKRELLRRELRSVRSEEFMCKLYP